MRPLLALLLAACDEAPADRMPSGAAGPPLTLTCTLFAPGAPFRCTVLGATPGATVYLAGGTPGRTCPPALGGACLDLRAPALLGSVTADASGRTVFDRTLPPTVPQGLTLAAQAAEVGPVSLSPAHQGTVYPALWLDGAAGQHDTCMLAGDGTPRCFGSSTLTPPPGVRFSTIDVSQGGVACGLEVGTGAARCFGSGGRLMATPPTGAFVDLTTGYDHACVRDAADQVTCWGSSYGAPAPFGMVAWDLDATWDGTCALGAGDAMTCFGLYGYSRSWPATPGAFQQVAVSTTSVTGLRTDGTLAWFRQTGVSTQDPGPPPAGTWTQVASGGWDACALDTAGAARCWGARGSTWSPLAGAYERLLVGNEGACAWSALGPVRCWGSWPRGAPTDLPAAP